MYDTWNKKYIVINKYIVIKKLINSIIWRATSQRYKNRKSILYFKNNKYEITTNKRFEANQGILNVNNFLNIKILQTANYLKSR